MAIRVRCISYKVTAILCSVLLVPGGALSVAQQAAPQAGAPAQDSKIPNDQLDSLVAPIALYPDPLLAQVLAASTYPLELVQLKQWLDKNKGLKDKALADAVQKQPWDASVQAMAEFPDVVKQMVDGIQWTTDLGNAFLAQQNDVMDAVQRMRVKAKDSGKLKSSDQMKVETKTVENKNVVVIQQADPQVVYVPSYNPTVVWGAPPYPYPPVYYPPPGYYAAGMAISFGVGLAMGAAWGGGWGWGCGWGGNNEININRNNTFVNNSNRQNFANNRQNVNNRGGNTWQHNPQHRGGTPYSNRSTANRYGGTARGDSMATRQANARQNQAQFGNRQQGGNLGGGSAGSLGANRGGGGAGGGSLGGAGGGDRVGNRSVSSGSSGGGAFGGGGSGSAARASSQRGSASRGGGGFSRGGGGRGGGRGRR